MTLDLAIRSLLRDVVREVVREELGGGRSSGSPGYLTYSEAAELVGVSAKTVKQWAYSGRLATYGEGRIKRVKPDEVRACLSMGRRAPRASIAVDDVVAQMLARSKR